MAATVEQFLETLAENSRVILLGGLAVVAHGLPRTTKDADVWLEPYDEDSWLRTVSNTVDKFEMLEYFDLRQQKICREGELPDIIRRDAVIRIVGLDRPVDIFLIPHNFEAEDFDEVWKHAEITLNKVRVADEIDLLLSKAGTGRSVDIADISFLEDKIRSKLTAILSVASSQQARQIFARYYDYQICRAALKNSNSEVVKIALDVLSESAKAGDPFAREILQEYEGGKTG